MSEHREESLQVAAGLLALVLPGLGQASLGKVRRGVLIAVGVLGLFLSGLVIGGIDVVDSKEDRWWFLGQALVGPTAFVVNGVNQRLSEADPGSTAGPGWFEANPPARMKSLSHVNEIGSLLTTIAGMLNLIVIIDAFWSAPAERARSGGIVGSLEGGGR